MGEDNLGIELISKDGIINALIPIMSELSIDDNAQGKIFLTIMNQKVAYDVEKVVAEIKELRVDDNYKCIDIVRKGGVE